MQEPTEEVQRGEPQVAHGASYPRAEERPPFATAGGEAPPPSRVRNLASGRNVPHYDSIADAMLPPYPVGMPAIYPVPEVTNAQRRRLKRAIDLYRGDE